MTAPSGLGLGEQWQGLLRNWQRRRGFAECFQEKVILQQLIKEVSVQCLICREKKKRKRNICFHKMEIAASTLLLACGPSLPAGSAGVAAIFCGFWTFFLSSQDILHLHPCLFLSSWAFTGLSIKNRFVVVTEQESERLRQAKQTVILQLKVEVELNT